MSTIVLSCPGCGKRYELSASLAGKKARCKACSREFTIPVPRQTAPQPEPDSFNPYDDVEDHAGVQSSVTHDHDDDTYLPPRAKVAPRHKSRPAASKSSSRGESWSVIPLIGLALTLVLFLGAFLENPAGIIAFGFLCILALLLMACGGIWSLVIACREGAVYGLLVFLVPFYCFYYAITRWHAMKSPFATLSTGLLVCMFAPPIFIAAGVLRPGPGAGAGNAFPPRAGAPFGQPPRGFGGAPAPGEIIGHARDLERNQNAVASAIRQRLGDRALTIRVHGIPLDNHENACKAVNEEIGKLFAAGGESTSMSSGDFLECVGGSDHAPEDVSKEIRFGRVTRVRGRLIEVAVSQQFLAALPVAPQPSVAAANAPQPAKVVIPAGADEVTKALLQVASPDVFQRGEGTRSLLSLPPNERRDKVVSTVVPLLGNSDGFFVIELLKILEHWQTPEAVAGIAAQTRNSQFGVRWAALEALGRIKDPSTIDAIVARLKEDGFKAKPALQQFGATAEPALIAVLSSPDVDVRKAACELLREFGGKPTLEAMQSLPADSDPFVRSAANEAMKAVISRVGPLPAVPATPKRQRSRL
jgi:hypothetical protein